MKELLHLLPLTLLAATPLLTQGTDPVAVQDEAQPATAPEAKKVEQDHRAAARTLAKGWSIAAYEIIKGKKQTGLYVQKNSMAKVEDEHVIICTDYITFPAMSAEMTFQTIFNATEGFSARGVKGELPMGKLRVEIAAPVEKTVAQEDGSEAAAIVRSATGMQVGQTPIEVDLPDEFIVDFSLLRGLPWMQRVKDWEAEFNYVDIETLPTKGSVTVGKMRCMGEEELEVGGQVFSTWKFRWTLPEEQATFLWYGPEGQLIKRKQKRESWVYSPSRTAKQIAIAEAEARQARGAAPGK